MMNQRVTLMKETQKMIRGYVLGGLLVLVIVPSLIRAITALADLAYRIPITGNSSLRWIIVIFLLVAGFAFGITSIVYQNIVGKGGPLEISNIEISPKTRNLVVSGPYRYCRNPMLFGTFMVYFALALVINSLTAVILIVLLAAFMLMVVVKLEEKRLLKDFGEQYRQYRRKTSKIIPWFPKNGS